MNGKNDPHFRSFFPNINETIWRYLLPPGRWIILHFAIAVLLPHSPIFGQAIEHNVQRVLEDQVENNEDIGEWENELIENLEHLSNNPVLIENTAPKALLDYNLISEMQCYSLSEYIAEYGKLISIYELQAVPLFDLPSIRRILPFIRIRSQLDDPNLSVKNLLFGGKYQLILRYTTLLQLQEGYRDTSINGYLGNQAGLYARFRYKQGKHISYGLTAEKDPGEQFFKGSQSHGFDFYSAHFFMKEIGGIKAIVIGDYDIRLGQGLIAWSGFGFGKGANVTTVKKTGSKIRPYASVQENQFKRGTAATVNFGSLTLTAFYSDKKIDANVAAADPGSGSIVAVSSLLNSGLHRNTSELEDRRTLKETVIGGSIGLQNRKWQFAINSISTFFDAHLERKLSLYNGFEFSGNQLHNVSLDYALRFRNVHFFGETALSNNGGMALLNGLLVNLDKKADLALVYRNYQRDYQSIYANAFGENSSPNNEKGVYFGLNIRPLRAVRINAYFDLYKHPWLKFRTNAPSSGQDAHFQVNYIPSKDLQIYARYRIKVEGRNSGDAIHVIDHVSFFKMERLRFHVSFKPVKSVTVATRFETTRYGQRNLDNNRSGYQLYQNISFRPLSFPVSFSARFSLFQSSSSDTRVYAYENDIPGNASIPAFIGSGNRFYLMIRYKLGRHLDCWIRYGRTRFPGKQIITKTSSLSDSPGKSAILGDRVEEIKMQLRFKF